MKELNYNTESDYIYTLFQHFEKRIKSEKRRNIHS